MVARRSESRPGSGRQRRRPLAWLAVAASLGLVLWLTLQSHGHSGIAPTGNHFTPFSEAAAALRAAFAQGHPLSHPPARFWIGQIVGNIVVFMPLGASLAWLRWIGGSRILAATSIATLGGAMVSLGVELGQLALPSRATDVDDLILNTLGAGLGGLVAAVVLQWRDRP